MFIILLCFNVIDRARNEWEKTGMSLLMAYFFSGQYLPELKSESQKLVQLILLLS